MTTLHVTWYGTACFLLEMGALKVLVDPFFDRNSQSEPVLPITKGQVPTLDAIIVSHAHFDHITSIPYFLHRDHCRVLGNAVLKQNVEKLGLGQVWPDWPDRIEPSDLATVEIVEAGRAYEIGKGTGTLVQATPIPSRHCKFDLYQVKRILKGGRSTIRELIKYGKPFRAGDVLGWDFAWEGKRIVVFGSLCGKFPEKLAQHAPCDLFFIPLAGRNEPSDIGINMTKALQAKIVIPTHYDHFFPPISQWTDISPYEKKAGVELPGVKIIKPTIGERTQVDL